MSKTNHALLTVGRVVADNKDQRMTTQTNVVSHKQKEKKSLDSVKRKTQVTEKAQGDKSATKTRRNRNS
jgi:hypothetical protein